MTDAAQQPNRAERDSEIVTLTTNVREISNAAATIAGLNFIKNCVFIAQKVSPEILKVVNTVNMFVLFF